MNSCSNNNDLLYFNAIEIVEKSFKIQTLLVGCVAKNPVT